MKRHFAWLFFAATAIWAQKPVVSRDVMATQEALFDTRITRLRVDDPFNLLGNTRGIYLEKYGVVLSAEVGLAIVPGISPFHPEFTKEDKARVHQKKLQRVPLLRQAMLDQLVATAQALDMVPADEQIVLGVTLFYFSWEDISGLPRQIVMQASRKIFFATPRAQLAGAIRVQEF